MLALQEALEYYVISQMLFHVCALHAKRVTIRRNNLIAHIKKWQSLVPFFPFNLIKLKDNQNIKHVYFFLILAKSYLSYIGGICGGAG